MILLSDYVAGGAIRKLQFISSELITESTEWVAPSNGMIIVTASGGGGGVGWTGNGGRGGSTVITFDPDHVLTLGGGRGGTLSSSNTPDVGVITTSPEWSLYPTPTRQVMQGLPSSLGILSKDYGTDGFTVLDGGTRGGGGGGGDNEGAARASGETSVMGRSRFGTSVAAYGASIVKSPFQVRSGQNLLIEIGSGGSGGIGGVGVAGRRGGNGYVHIQFFKQD